MILGAERKKSHCTPYNKPRRAFVKICGCLEDDDRIESILGAPIQFSSAQLTSIQSSSIPFSLDIDRCHQSAWEFQGPASDSSF